MTHKDLKQMAVEILELVQKSGYSNSALVDQILLDLKQIVNTVEDEVLDRFESAFCAASTKKYYV